MKRDSRLTDMSPQAIDQRLRDLSQLHELGSQLLSARRLGPVEPEGTMTSASGNSPCSRTPPIEPVNEEANP